MPPEIYNDSECGRVIIRHLGPPGPGVPDGGITGQLLRKKSNADQDTEWGNAGAGLGDVVGPASSVNNRLSAFNGATGKLLKDSGILTSDIFTTTAAVNKVDKVTGKGLSTNDFTDALKAKLDAATAENFRGEYPTLLALTTAVPLGNPGDYANIVGVGVDPNLVIWDDLNDVWYVLNDFILDGQEVATAVFNPIDSAIWDQSDTRIYTTDEKTALANSASLDYVNSLALAAGLLTPAYGEIHYFNLTGTSIPIISVSDGSSNLVKVDVVSTLDPISEIFDSPVSSRLRFTGASSRLFQISFQLTTAGPASSVLVMSLSKNGSPIASSKLTQGSGPSSTANSVTNYALVSLSTNDYIEVLIGNTTNTSDPLVTSLSINAVPV